MTKRLAQGTPVSFVLTDQPAGRGRQRVIAIRPEKSKAAARARAKPHPDGAWGYVVADRGQGRVEVTILGRSLG